MFWCYRNGIGNLAVAYASERYDVTCVTMILVIKIVKIIEFGDLGYLTLHSNGWCWDRAQGSVYVELGVVLRWFWALLHIKDTILNIQDSILYIQDN